MRWQRASALVQASAIWDVALAALAARHKAAMKVRGRGRPPRLSMREKALASTPRRAKEFISRCDGGCTKAHESSRI